MWITAQKLQCGLFTTKINIWSKVFCSIHFYITDFVRSTHCFYSPMWIDFWISQALKFNYIFLSSCIFRFYITDFVRSTCCEYPPTWIDFWISQALKFNYIFFLQILCFRFYITDFVRSTHCFYSPTWIDFWSIIGVEVQLMLFARHFMFFPPEAFSIV